MNTAAIRDMADAHGPFASVYLPPDVGGSDWPVLRRTLAAQDTPQEILHALDHALSHGSTAEGRVLIANPSGVLVDGPLAWSPHGPVARLSDLPYLLPLVPKHAVRVPEAALVAAGPAGSGMDAPDRTMFDQFLFESSRPEGPVVQGIPRCTAVLRDHNADALVIAEGALADRTVWVGGTRRDQVAEDHADLRAVGMPASCQRADEALPMAALAVGADVLVAEGELDLDDGIGVLLSHP